MHKYDDLQQEFDNVFQPKKLSSLKYSNVLATLGETKRASRVRECGSYLEFGLYDDSTVKLHRANFCGDCLCPQCAKRKSLKVYSQLSACVDRIKNDYQFLFCTLTIKNCVSDELPSTCDLLYSAYNRLMDRKRMSFVKGAFRALEITVNRSKDTITYHPHLHCIFAVSKDYFQSPEYLTQKSLSELWGASLGVDYIPIVDIRTCKDKGFTKGGKAIFKSINSAVAEVAKYSVKSSDYLCGTDEQNKEVVKTLLSALRNRRMFVFIGVFRTVRQELKLDEVESGDLVHVESENQVNSAVLVAKLYFSFYNKYKSYINVGVKLVGEDTEEDVAGAVSF